MKWPLNISKDISSFLIVRRDFLIIMFHWLRQHVMSLVSTESCTFLTSKSAIKMNVFSHWAWFLQEGFSFFINLDFGGAHETFLWCLGESDALFLYSEELLLWASWDAEDSLTCIPVSSAVLWVYLCLLFGSSEIEAVIFLNARPHGFYLGFPHISVGNCEIHLQHRGATGYQCSA